MEQSDWSECYNHGTNKCRSIVDKCVNCTVKIFGDLTTIAKLQFINKNQYVKYMYMYMYMYSAVYCTCMYSTRIITIELTAFASQAHVHSPL